MEERIVIRRQEQVIPVGTVNGVDDFQLHGGSGLLQSG
jgi:hypothetical protein